MKRKEAAKQSDLTGRKMDTREQVIKWLNDNGHAKVTSKIIPLDNGNFRPVVDVIMGCLEQVKSVDLDDVGETFNECTTQIGMNRCTSCGSMYCDGNICT